MKNMEQNNTVQLHRVTLDGDVFFKISNIDQMRPFFMSIVSDSNHWMFIGSNGGISAGRKDAENALFPYYTDDKIIQSNEDTGSKSIFSIQKNGEKLIWEPFSLRNLGQFNVSRNLYKNEFGNKIIFEEVNRDLGLTFQYQWNSSNTYGFVRKSRLINTSNEKLDVTILDGIQNIMPAGVGSALQNQSSNLVNAYKRSELIKKSGVGIFALSAIIVDKAEPSEALKANVVWSLGLAPEKYLLSSLQVDAFRKGNSIHEELDMKAEPGAYFINATISIAPREEKVWMIIANVNQSIENIVALSESLVNDQLLINAVNQDIDAGTSRLIALDASADALQLTHDNLRDTRHFSNTLFNIMRGGIFDNNYQIEKNDVVKYFRKANQEVYNRCRATLEELPDEFALRLLKSIADKADDKNFRRLCYEYLPLKFSRRHGDPSRPWNRFSINTYDENDGSKILDYEGNWRDIFQNWEALALSYPEFLEGMIFKFLNASTFDGYNPYRITKNGIDWERIEADDPWSYIGYWGDHQIIYLLKFLEHLENHAPGKLAGYFTLNNFVYAHVPYRIKDYTAILNNPKDTIDFDHTLDHTIMERAATLGADGKLFQDQNGSIMQVNFLEKILAMVLAKLSNFIPEGGIWMNTQRPEWNDANNALVGNGVSVVTLCYLRRFMKFMQGVLSTSTVENVNVSIELATLLKSITIVFDQNTHLLDGEINDHNRKAIVDALGIAGSNYRMQIYDHSFSGQLKSITKSELLHFVELSLQYMEQTIGANKRDDKLYHAYNLMTIENDDQVSIAYLSEMLEGQVAVLSSGFLSSSEALSVLDGLKKSQLFREDQYSYILYPNKNLPGFTEKNNIPAKHIKKSTLLTKLTEAGNTSILTKDVSGNYHFNGNFKNAGDLAVALHHLDDTKYGELNDSNQKEVLAIFEEVFNHKAFTGRSGTFFGYEGLGSIYWHMVSKLQLAVQECCLKAIEENASEKIIGRLLEHYYEINQGIGVHKSPTLYGAFPTDPYSHTPAGKGAQQPGMTGQVKEDILSRFGELGVTVKGGTLGFHPTMLRKDEFLKNAHTFHMVDIRGESMQLTIEAGALCFTYCQVPIVYTNSTQNRVNVIYRDGSSKEMDGLRLDKEVSQQVFDRSGKIEKIIVDIQATILR